jgi:hypothetical protein
MENQPVRHSLAVHTTLGYPNKAGLNKPPTNVCYCGSVAIKLRLPVSRI